MSSAVLPRDLDVVLTLANVAEGHKLTPHEVDLGGLSQVVATVTDDEAILYGEFPVDAAAVEDLDPGEAQHDGSALSDVVEDWRWATDGTVMLSAYIYVQTHEHGPLGVTLGEALEALNALRDQCLAWLRSPPTD